MKAKKTKRCRRVDDGKIPYEETIEYDDSEVVYTWRFGRDEGTTSATSEAVALEVWDKRFKCPRSFPLTPVILGAHNRRRDVRIAEVAFWHNAMGPMEIQTMMSLFSLTDRERPGGRQYAKMADLKARIYPGGDRHTEPVWKLLNRLDRKVPFIEVGWNDKGKRIYDIGMFRLLVTTGYRFEGKDHPLRFENGELVIDGEPDEVFWELHPQFVRDLLMEPELSAQGTPVMDRNGHVRSKGTGFLDTSFEMIEVLQPELRKRRDMIAIRLICVLMGDWNVYRNKIIERGAQGLFAKLGLEDKPDRRNIERVARAIGNLIDLGFLDPASTREPLESHNPERRTGAYYRLGLTDKWRAMWHTPSGRIEIPSQERARIEQLTIHPEPDIKGEDVKVIREKLGWTIRKWASEMGTGSIWLWSKLENGELDRHGVPKPVPKECWERIQDLKIQCNL